MDICLRLTGDLDERTISVRRDVVEIWRVLKLSGGMSKSEGARTNLHTQHSE
jgi:hypothetical protein